MRFLPDGATSPIFLSSGAEDYFLSAYYFNQGEFKTPNSGLTYYDGKGSLRRRHTRCSHPICHAVCSRRLLLSRPARTRRTSATRCCSATGCGWSSATWRRPRAAATCSTVQTSGAARAPTRPLRRRGWRTPPPRATHPHSACPRSQTNASLRDHLCYWPGARIAPSEYGRYNTLVWAYEWPKGSERAEVNAAAAAAAVPFDAASAEGITALGTLARLGRADLLPPAEEDAADDALLGGDRAVLALLHAAPAAGDARTARHLQRQLGRLD